MDFWGMRPPAGAGRPGLRARAAALLLLGVVVSAVAAEGQSADDEWEAMAREYDQFRRDGRMGLRRYSDGKVIVPPRYDFVALPAEGLVRVQDDGGVAYLDMAGREQIPLSAGWQAGHDFSEGLAAVRRDELWGYIDRAGRVVITPRFDYAEGFRDGRARVRGGETDDTTYIDLRGEPICDCWFDYALDFDRGYAIVGEWTKLGILRRDGRLVLKPAFYRIENLGGGRFKVLRRTGEKRYPVYTEGTYTVGDGIEWNDNMAPVNAMVQRAKLFIGRLEELMDHWLETGCPCRYPRFRELMMHSPERESVFSVVRDRFLDRDEGEGHEFIDYTCRVCGSRYRATWYEYSAFAQGYNVELVQLAVDEEGARLVRPMPFLRFQTGYRMASEDRFVEVEDVDLVLAYLARRKGEEEQRSLLDRLRRWVTD